MSTEAPSAKLLVRYFISYTREDGRLSDKLLTELRKKLGADRDYEFKAWRDTEIPVGKAWHDEIQAALRECDFGLLLVSPAFLGRRYITAHELPHFVRGDKPCVPVALSRIDFEEMDLKGLEALQFFGYIPPRDSRPRSFEECTSAKHQSAFALELYRSIKARLGDLFGNPLGRDLSSSRGAIDEAAYRTHLRKHYRHLQLEALTSDQFTFRDIQLRSVFIPQDAREADAWLKDSSVVPDKTARDTSKHGEVVALSESLRFRETTAKPVLELLERAPHRVVLGAPGAGKSSLTRMRLLAWAEDASGARPLPVLIELRRFHRSGREDFLDYLAHDKDLVFRFAADDLRARLAAGSAEILFDGLDEIFDPIARENAARQIARYSETFPEARLLVTSRIIGYPDRVLRDAEFAHWLLAEFDDTKIALFLDHWMESAIAEPGDRPTVRRRLDEALRNKVLRELAGNPLLLTLMAVLARKSDLPRDLGSVYARAVDLLLEQWDTHRFLSAHVEFAGVIIDYKDKRDLLRDLAWEMQTGRYYTSANLVTEAQLQEEMDRAFRHRIADDGARRRAIALLIDQLTERNYLLAHVGGAQFGFIHRGFLDFFVSEYLLHVLATKPDTALAELTGYFQMVEVDDTWLEPIILTATRLEPTITDRILFPLIGEPSGVDVGAAIWGAAMIPFVLACRILARSREPEKIAQTYGRIRPALEEWVRHPDAHFKDTEDEWRIAQNCVRLLAETFPDARTRTLLMDSAQVVTSSFHDNVVYQLGRVFPDEQTRTFLMQHAREMRLDSRGTNAFWALARHFPDNTTRRFLLLFHASAEGNEALLGATQAMTLVFTPTRESHDFLVSFCRESDENRRLLKGLADDVTTSLADIIKEALLTAEPESTIDRTG